MFSYRSWLVRVSVVAIPALALLARCPAPKNEGLLHTMAAPKTEGLLHAHVPAPRTEGLLLARCPAPKNEGLLRVIG